MSALWDLRDSAYDRPEVWRAFTTEVFLQGLARELDETPTDRDGQISMLVIARALGKALDPRPR